MKNLLIAASLTVLTMGAAQAENAMTPAIVGEIAMAEDMIALGTARGEPLMVLAGIRLMSTLGGEMGAPGVYSPRSEAAFAAARAAAAGDKAMLAIVDDVDAEGARRMPICARNGFCY